MFSYIFNVDRELRLCSWDKNLQLVKNTTFAEIQGKPYYEVLPRIWGRDDDALKKVICDGTPLKIKGYQIACFYGISVADLSIDPVIEDGEVIGARVKTETYPDCTLSKLMQQSLQSQVVIDMEKISTTLAHGVRNPLNAIKGAIVYLNDQYKHEAKLVEFAHIIEDEISKLDNFITRFLSTSFVDTEISDNDLNLLLDNIVTLISLQAQSRKIIIKKNYGKIPLIKFDSFHIENAILNIINNSIEAMPKGGCISLQTSIQVRNEMEYVVVEVADTGPGMSDSKINDLMCGEGRHNEKKGRGFGLFITREIVQHHGGYMEVSSEKGTGTSVRIYLAVESM
jgi:two-component system nitrogen regulation sensor histidine kinase GlnL